jgi:hypothetical protein
VAVFRALRGPTRAALSTKTETPARGRADTPSQPAGLRRLDFAFHPLAKRRLCKRVGGRFIGGTSRCCALSAAQSRAAATTNLARSNHSLRALFAGAKRSTLVNIFMICPRGPARDSRPGSILPLIAAISWRPVSMNRNGVLKKKTPDVPGLWVGVIEACTAMLPQSTDHARR